MLEATFVKHLKITAVSNLQIEADPTWVYVQDLNAFTVPPEYYPQWWKWEPQNKENAKLFIISWS